MMEHRVGGTFRRPLAEGELAMKRGRFHEAPVVGALFLPQPWPLEGA